MTDPVGRVVQLNAKSRVPGERGLPKIPRHELRVSKDGVDGDFNVWRQEEKGGDRTYALLLLPIETIRELNREGWPVRPGDLGENLTVEGIPYAAFGPPRRFRAGSVVGETSKACEPCDNLFRLPYVGAERGPEFLRTTLGRRGWYARVVDPGSITTGDTLTLEPAP